MQAVLLLLLAGALGDLWHWVKGVVARIGDVAVYWLVLGLAFKTCESALLGLVWRNILRAAYPKSLLSFKTAWGASQGGTAINALVPAQGGTAAMIGIFRASIPGSSVAGIASAVVVQALFFTAISIVMVIVAALLRPHTVSKGSPSDEIGHFFSAHPLIIPVAIVVAIVLLVFVWPRLKPRVVKEWHKVKQGAAIFSDWGRYGREVALPSGASYCCRIACNMIFMFAFGIPVTAFTVFLVASSHMLSGLFAITPGGVGQTQALDVASLGGYVATGTVAAFSITQDSVITLWNIVLGIGVMLWAFGLTQVKALLSKKSSDQAKAPA
jgi:uncharacterized membrane protein YbhN (UPF0104 family)